MTTSATDSQTATTNQTAPDPNPTVPARDGSAQDNSAPAPDPVRRQDILVSVCISDIDPGPHDATRLQAIATTLEHHYRFWEIVLVVAADAAGDFTPLLSEISNLRLLKVRRQTDFYRRRAVAAAEAIGDVVLLTSPGESAHLDLPAMIDAAADRAVMVVGTRPSASRRNATLNPLLRALGRSGGFHVSARTMLTMALPRTLLNQLLARPDPQLSLRFPPRDAGIVIETVVGDRGDMARRGLKGLGRRMTLTQRVLMSSAPKMLVYVAFVSALVALTGFSYAVYSVGAWIMLDTLAEGWLTLSLMLSMTAMVLGMALLGMSLGLQQVLDRLSPETLDDVVDEMGSMDFFRQVASDLNVEVETDTDRTDPDTGPDPATARPADQAAATTPGPAT